MWRLRPGAAGRHTLARALVRSGAPRGATEYRSARSCRATTTPNRRLRTRLRSRPWRPLDPGGCSDSIDPRRHGRPEGGRPAHATIAPGAWRNGWAPGEGTAVIPLFLLRPICGWPDVPLESLASDAGSATPPPRWWMPATLAKAFPDQAETRWMTADRCGATRSVTRLSQAFAPAWMRQAYHAPAGS
jgi:hypothetical protein